ncbi:mechanosensitive ion channel protein 6-like [Bidens hawaiensis]|uniref:mechanosensitive ion channel protein 6-like n=1 Tax=Bidens hawaiensis TaxID=980011 RepID=UPI00404B5575
MTRLMDAVRTGVLLPTPDEQLDHESAGRTMNEKKAGRAANRIVNNLAKQGSQCIYTADLMRFLREDEALKTIRLFDGEPETNGVSKEVFKSWVLHVYRDQKALSLSLKDINKAGNKLHCILSFMVGVMIVAICLIILELVHPYIVVFLCTTLLLPVFLFGISCESAFKGIIFLFVTHPYDVGDLCEIDGVQFIVQKMHILTADFLIPENNKISTCYNSLLAMK